MSGKRRLTVSDWRLAKRQLSEIVEECLGVNEQEAAESSESVPDENNLSDVRVFATEKGMDDANSFDEIKSNNEQDQCFLTAETLVIRKSTTDGDIKKDLQKWSINCKVPNQTVNKLLQILKKHTCFKNLPSDARTLKKTCKKKCNVALLEPGIYAHVGLGRGIARTVVSLGLDNFSSPLQVSINCDGLPLFQNSSQSLWPILGSVEPLKSVFIIGAFYGKGKPKDSNEYLQNFVDEAIALIEEGITINDRKFQVRIRNFVCDTPAKSFILCVKGHAGYNSCTKCYIVGSHKEGGSRLFFDEVNCFDEVNKAN